MYTQYILFIMKTKKYERNPVNMFKLDLIVIWRSAAQWCDTNMIYGQAAS